MDNKYRSCIKSICILMAVTIGACILAPKTVLAKPVDQEQLMKQLTKAFEEGEVYEIIQDGSGDFITIQDGVNAAVSGDTLLIYPGVYEEVVEIYDKTVHLLGTDKEQCIIQYDSSKYSTAPLNIGAGNVSNLTIYGYLPLGAEELNNSETSTKLFSNDSEETIEGWREKFPGYAIHIDQDYSFGNDILFENCKIVSNNNQCIGIGSRGNSSITFRACELYSNGMAGCIYFHNTSDVDFAGETYFTLKDCILKNYECPYVIAMHSFGTQNLVYLTFQNIEVSTVAYERKFVYSPSNMNTFLDVEDLRNIRDLSYFSKNGLYSTMGTEIITEYNNIGSFRNGHDTGILLNISDNPPRLVEGISYVLMMDSELDNKEIEKRDDVKSRKRQVIDIYNYDQLVGTGWCGLEGIYLTPESYGNTLFEMNYPEPMISEEAAPMENEILEDVLVQ